MSKAGLITRLLLAAFVTNASLCPCAPAASPSAPDGMPATAGMHHATGHEQHGEHGTAPASQSEAEDCHTDSPVEECGMAMDAELAALSLESERTGAAIPASVLPTRALTLPGRRYARPAPLPPDRVASATPVTNHDRLLT